MPQHPDIPDDELLEGEGLLALETLASLLPSGAADPERRRAFFDALPTSGRLDRFADAAARMLDISVEQAREMLDGAARAEGYEPSPFSGVRLYHVSGGPKVSDAITGFVRITAGAEFPDHDHLGDETVLIVQGSCVDMPSGTVYRPGDVVAGTPGGMHSVMARPGPDLVYLAVLHGGLDVAGTVLRPGDPNI